MEMMSQWVTAASARYAEGSLVKCQLLLSCSCRRLQAHALSHIAVRSASAGLRFSFILFTELEVLNAERYRSAEAKQAPPEVGTAQDDMAVGEAARRAVMLSQLASADESRPGTLERILQQASLLASVACEHCACPFDKALLRWEGSQHVIAS